jgi:gas vesicle protein
MKKLVTFLMVAGLFAGLAFSGEDGDKEVKKSEKQDAAPVEKGELKRPERSSLAGRPERGSVNREDRYQQMLSRRAEIHKQAIDELEEIKKIAQEENATRTVEALQKMIDKKNAEYKKDIEEFTRTQQKRADQIRQRTGNPGLTPSEKKVKEAATQEEPVK